MADQAPKGPPRKPSSKRARFDKSKWLYQKDGRDVGPFSPAEIKDLMRKNQLTLNDRVRRSTGQQWHQLGEVEAFAGYFEEISAERQEKAQERALDAVENAVRSKRKIPQAIAVGVGVALALAAIAYGWSLWKAANAGSVSGYSSDLLKPLDLGKVPTRAYLDTSGKIQWPSEQVGQRKGTARDKRNRKIRKGTTATGVKLPRATGTSDDLSPQKRTGVTEVAFDKASIGRELTSQDIRRVRSAVVPKLIGCARREANRRPSFPGTTVSFSIRPSGSVGGVRVGANGRRSGSFVACAKRSVRSARVAPFDGSSRTVTVPLNVGRK